MSEEPYQTVPKPVVTPTKTGDAELDAIVNDNRCASDVHEAGESKAMEAKEDKADTEDSY